MGDKFVRSTVAPWGLLGAATVVAGTGTVVGFLGRLWWGFELFSHFRAQYFLFLAGSALLFLLGRKLRPAGLTCVLALVNVSLIIPLYVGGSWTHAGGRTVRVVLMNLHASNQAHEKMQEFIRAVGPDFMVLLEVNEQWAHAIQKLQAQYPFSRVRPRGDDFGIALLSRIPFEQAEIRDIGEAEAPSVIARFAIDGEPLTVIGTHPPPPMGRDYSAHRNQQLTELAHVVGLQKGPVMVLGDLNSTSWSPFFGDLIRETGLRDSRNGFGVQPTWPDGIPIFWIPIDHCLVSSRVVVHHRKVGPDIGSDHYPIVVDFSIEPPSSVRDLTGQALHRDPPRPLRDPLKKTKGPRVSRGPSRLELVPADYSLTTFAACLPFGPSTTSNSSDCPSVRVLNPSP